MTVGEWLTKTVATLKGTGLKTARLDSLVLLEDVTGIDRARLLAEPAMALTETQKVRLAKLLKRRLAHEPLAYLRGKTEFYGREFVVTPAVLEPRPESETMIELLKELALEHRFSRLADVGAGSGALGITAKLELPEVQVDLLEIDPDAAKVAQLNVAKYTIDISVMVGDLLKPTRQNYDILLCNLPYVPDDHLINQAAQHEPQVAIFGGPDGLEVYRRLFQQIAALTVKPLFILTESLPAQHAALQTVAERANYQLLRTADFIQLFRAAV